MRTSRPFRAFQFGCPLRALGVSRQKGHVRQLATQEGLDQRLAFIDDADAVVTIDAGTTLEFDRRAGLRVNAGTLRATGEAAEPITFTSASREPNDWRGVGIAANTGNVLDHVVIESAGVSWNAINNSTPTNLYVSSVGRVVVTNSAFNNSAGWGIYNGGTITNGDGNSIDPATQGGNTFSGNASGDVGS